MYIPTDQQIITFGKNALSRIKVYASEKSRHKSIEKRAANFAEVTAQSNFMDGLNYVYSGEKFEGGWGLSKNYEVVNLKELQNKSLELWRSNPIANAIFGRLETKVINDGLLIESTPEIQFLGMTADDPMLPEWTSNAEGYFNLHAMDFSQIDYRKRFNFYELQRQAFNTAKLSGDCLIIRRINRVTQMPNIQLIDGRHIETPFGFIGGINNSTGRDVIQGVEVDKKGRVVGYWVRVKGLNPNSSVLNNLKYKFIPAVGSQSKRNTANLIYGSRVRVDEYRGLPLLGASVQMLKQIDRTLDNAQLAMALDASLVMSVVKDVKAPTSLADQLQGGAIKKVAVTDTNKTVTQSDGSSKEVNFKQFGPGIMFDNLPAGTKIESHNSRHPNPNIKDAVLFGMQVVSASVNVPPEIMMLLFNNNFSASRQAVNEFNGVIRTEHSKFTPYFNDPVYQDVLIGLEITGKLVTPGLLDSLLSGDSVTFNSWVQAQWASKSELSVDMLKHIKMLQIAVKEGFTTRTKTSLEFFASRFEKNMAIIGKENKAIAAAWKPLLELTQGQDLEGIKDFMQYMSAEGGNNIEALKDAIELIKENAVDL